MGRVLTWTPVEDDLIRQVYPASGASGCLAMMPNRSRDHIRYRAYTLGVMSKAGQKMKTRMARKPEGSYPWPPLSDLDRLALREWGRAANGPVQLVPTITP